MDAKLQEILDNLNKKNGKETEEKTDDKRCEHAKLILDVVKAHEEMYGTASACAAISALVVAGFTMALRHSHEENDD